MNTFRVRRRAWKIKCPPPLNVVRRQLGDRARCKKKRTPHAIKDPLQLWGAGLTLLAGAWGGRGVTLIYVSRQDILTNERKLHCLRKHARPRSSDISFFTGQWNFRVASPGKWHGTKPEALIIGIWLDVTNLWKILFNWHDKFYWAHWWRRWWQSGFETSDRFPEWNDNPVTSWFPSELCTLTTRDKGIRAGAYITQTFAPSNIWQIIG